jgi:Ubiquitin carboxyl-terminal hydrolase
VVAWTEQRTAELKRGSIFVLLVVDNKRLVWLQLSDSSVRICSHHCGLDSIRYLNYACVAMSRKSRNPAGLRGGHATTATVSSRQVVSNTHWICAEDSCDFYDLGPKGLKNVGNSCYANATLQCLLNTALSHALTDPVASAIFRRYSSNPNILAQGSGSVDSEEDCTATTGTGSSTLTNSSAARRKHLTRERKRLEDLAMQENCQWLSQELRQITKEYHAPDVRSGSWLYGPPKADVVNPGTVTRNPHRLSSSLTPYQQEDAHEFLRALLSTLVMNGQNKELSSLFDGLLESAVTCQTCYRPSLTRDRYMDLSLDIADANIKTLRDALCDFTTTETLAGENSVYCRHCECKRTATKGLRLATAPTILVCHLKRFAYDEFGRLVRLKKKIKIPLRLEIGDFMSRVNQARPPPYELVAVLVHQGNTCECGHYLAYVKHAGSWYRCNDAVVEPVEVDTVLAQQAYIVFYEVAEMRERHGFSMQPKSAAQDGKSKHSVGSSGRYSASPKQAPRDDFFSTASAMLLCGMDYESSVFSELCHFNWGGSARKPRRSPRRGSRRDGESGSHHSHDELSTLGESTVESTDTQRKNRFRRSSSSGNLRDHPRNYAARSMSVSTRHRRQHSSTGFGTGEPAPDNAAEWKARNAGRTGTLRARRNDELPPRPGIHRRVLSSEDTK